MKKTALLIALLSAAIFAQTKDMVIHSGSYSDRFGVSETDSVTFKTPKELVVFTDKSRYRYEVEKTDSIAFEYVPGGKFIVKYLDEKNKPIPGLDEDTVEAKLNVETTIDAKATPDYYRITSGQITDVITKDGETKDIIFKYEKISDEEKYSYISIVYTNTTKPITENAELKFYVSDYEQSDYINGDLSKRFDIVLKLNGDKREFKDLTIGNVTLDLGKLPAGEYSYTVQATDKSNGRKTQELYGEFRVLDFEKEQQEIAAKTYRVTEEDLRAYSIKNSDDAANALATKNGIKKLISDKSSAGIRKLVMLPGIYTVEVEQRTKVNQAGTPDEWKQYFPENIIEIPSRFTLDLNGATLKMKQTPLTQITGVMITMDSVYDAHLINGTLCGDNREKDLENIPNGNAYGEHIKAGGINGGSKYCSWENLTVTNFSGYAVTTGLGNNSEHAICGEYITFTAGDLDDQGKVVPKRNKFTSQMVDISVVTNYATGTLMDVNTLRIGRFLAYQWIPSGREWHIDVAFYDENKELIEKSIANQYREILRPENARYLRFSYVATSTDELKDIMVYHGYFPKNCVIRDITFDDNRTCGLAPFQGNNIVIEECKFINTARRITPVAIDFEDGWYLMQDYCVRNNEVLVPVGTADIVVVGGLNLQFIKNKNFRYSTNNCNPGTVIEDNENIYTLIYIADRVRSGYYRFQRNSFKRELGPANANGEKNFDRTVPLVYRDCSLSGSGAGSTHPMDKFIRCTFDFENKETPFDMGGMIKGIFEDCTLKNYTSNKSLGIGDATFTNCTFSNSTTLILQGKVKFINSQIDGFTIRNWNNRSVSLTFEECDLKEFYLDRNTFISQIDLQLTGCTIANSSRPNIINDAYRNLNRADEYLNITTSGNTLHGTTGFVTEALKSADNPYIDLSKMK